MSRLLLLAALPVAVIVAAALAGALYQVLAARRDLRSLPFAVPGGRFVTLPSRRKVYVCDIGTNNHGSPTIVFESGMVVSTLNWHAVQHALARSTRTFSYDRPGLGWSDPPPAPRSTKAPRTPQVLADELRTLLAAANVPPPYLFVAHSYGVLPVRAFAAQTPHEVAAIVLLDPIRTEGWLPGNPAGRAIMAGGTALMRRARIPTRLGITRIAAQALLRPNWFTTLLFLKFLGKPGKRSADRMTREVGKMAPEVQPAVIAQWSRPGFYAGSAAHIQDLPASVEQIQQMPLIEQVPTLILHGASSPPVAAEYAHCRGPLVTEQRLSNAHHWIHLDQPQVVIAILEKRVAELTPVPVTCQPESVRLQVVA